MTPPSKNHIHFGGSVAAGKTSNVELDVFLSLTKRDDIAPVDAHIFPQLDAMTVKTIKKRLRDGMTVLFPIFARHHWIVGILDRVNGKDSILLYDSAPSPMVHRDVHKTFRSVWPELTIEFAYSPHQERGRDDCGIYTLAALFSRFFGIRVADGDTLARRLRPLLASYMKKPTPKALFFDQLRDALLGKLITGGAAPRRRRGDTQPVPTPAPVRSPPAFCYEAERRADLRRVRALYTTHKDANRFVGSRTTRSVFVALSLLSVAERTKRALQLTNLALHCTKIHLPAGRPADVADILYLNGLVVIPYDACQPRAATVFRPAKDYQEAFAHDYTFVCKMDGLRSLSSPNSGSLPERLVPPRGTTPQVQRAFFAGATFVPESTHDCAHYELTEQLEEATIGLYIPLAPSAPETGDAPAATTSVSTGPRRRLCHGAFLRHLDSDGSSVFSRSSPAPSQTREDLNEGDGEAPAAVAAGTRLAQDEEEADNAWDPSDNAGDYMRRARTTHTRVDQSADLSLNRRGGRLDQRGRGLWGDVCPRDWVIWPKDSPHAHRAAWDGISEEERSLHVAWLRRFRDMPADLLGLKPERAATEMLDRDAMANRYTWTTYVRKLGLIQSALKNLPLYTNQARGIDLIAESPEWRATVKAAKRWMKQAETHPPLPLTRDAFEKVYKALRSRSPMASLYAMLMWCTTARAVDIERLKVRDVSLTPTPRQTAGTAGTPTTAGTRTLTTRSTSPATDLRPLTGRFLDAAEMTHITVQMKRGKGALFRGPYTVYTALPRREAAMLSELLSTRRPALRLFPGVQGLRVQTLAAITEVEPRAQMPSIRKGAIQFLAAQGLSPEELMSLTGHTRLETLHRYLGDGRPLTREEGERQARVGRALHRRRTVPR